MAPRAPESRSWFLQRLRREAGQLGARHVGFGAPHWSHGVVLEGGVYRVRRLVLSREKADAYLRAHGIFMPEHAERLSEPTGEVVLEAPTLEGLIGLLEAGPWPL